MTTRNAITIDDLIAVDTIRPRVESHLFAGKLKKDLQKLHYAKEGIALPKWWNDAFPGFPKDTVMPNAAEKELIFKAIQNLESVGGLTTPSYEESKLSQGCAVQAVGTNIIVYHNVRKEEPVVKIMDDGSLEKPVFSGKPGVLVTGEVEVTATTIKPVQILTSSEEKSALISRIALFVTAYYQHDDEAGKLKIREDSVIKQYKYDIVDQKTLFRFLTIVDTGLKNDPIWRNGKPLKGVNFYSHVYHALERLPADVRATLQVFFAKYVLNVWQDQERTILAKHTTEFGSIEKSMPEIAKKLKSHYVFNGNIPTPLEWTKLPKNQDDWTFEHVLKSQTDLNRFGYLKDLSEHLGFGGGANVSVQNRYFLCSMVCGLLTQFPAVNVVCGVGMIERVLATWKHVFVAPRPKINFLVEKVSTLPAPLREFCSRVFIVGPTVYATGCTTGTGAKMADWKKQWAEHLQDFNAQFVTIGSILSSDAFTSEDITVYKFGNRPIDLRAIYTNIQTPLISVVLDRLIPRLLPLEKWGKKDFIVSSIRAMQARAILPFAYSYRACPHYGMMIPPPRKVKMATEGVVFENIDIENFTVEDVATLFAGYDEEMEEKRRKYEETKKAQQAASAQQVSMSSNSSATTLTAEPMKPPGYPQRKWDTLDRERRDEIVANYLAARKRGIVDQLEYEGSDHDGSASGNGSDEDNGGDNTEVATIDINDF